jgi:hypothetical protein
MCEVALRECVWALCFEVLVRVVEVRAWSVEEKKKKIRKKKREKEHKSFLLSKKMGKH